MADIVSLKQKPEGARAPFTETPTATQMLEILSIVHRQGPRMALLTGVPGCGKTTAAREFVRQNPAGLGTSPVWMVSATPVVGGISPFIRMLYEQAFRHQAPDRAYAMRRELAQLIDRDSHPPSLVIDDAHHLANKTMMEIRAYLHDGLGMTIVFMGHPRLATRFLDKHGHDLEEWQEFTSRLYIRRSFAGNMPGDAEAVCFNQARTTTDARRRLCDLREHPGRLRAVSSVLSLAQEFAGDGGLVTIEHVEKAIVMSGVRA